MEIQIGKNYSHLLSSYLVPGAMLSRVNAVFLFSVQHLMR